LQDICSQLMSVHSHAHTSTQYSVNIVKELRDNEAKFKVCMAYSDAVLGFIITFSMFFPDRLCLLAVHTQVYPKLAPMKACESRHQSFTVNKYSHSLQTVVKALMIHVI